MRPNIGLCLAICLLMPAVMGALNEEAMVGGVSTSDSGDPADQPLIVPVRPSDYGQMVEMTGFSEEPLDDSNALWVVDDTGQMNDTLSMPLDSYVRVFITPIQGGNVVVEHLYPDDQSQSNSMGMVEPYHTYGIWFYGDILGTHQMRYNVSGGEYSNIVEFYVGAQEDVQKPLTVWSGWQ